MSLHIAFCHIAVSHKIEHAGEDEFDLEALEEAKIRKLKMLASLKIIRKAQMIDNAGKIYKASPKNIITSFRTRVPTITTMEAYLNQNINSLYIYYICIYV